MVEEKLINFLIEKQALKFGEFTLKSGRKSPYFFTTGSLNSGAALDIIGKAYAKIIEENNLDFEVIFGPAYKGIPLAVCAACALLERGMNKKIAYDRKEVKEHGVEKEKMIVGDLQENDRILLVDDVVTTGATKFETVEKISSLGLNLKIIGLLILFDRQEVGETGKSAVQELEEKGLKVYAALNAKQVFEYLHNKEVNGKIHVTDEVYNKFVEYQEKYGVK